MSPRLYHPPKMPPRAVRVDDDLWNAAMVTAAGRRETVSEVVRRALKAYVKRNGQAA